MYLCVEEVVSPQRSNLVLTTDVPHCEIDILVFDRLHIEPYNYGDTVGINELITLTFHHL